MKVIIVGGGIGGLALAIGLEGAGFLVQVHERTAAIEKLGSAIALWRNALRALEHLGLLDPVLAAAGRVEAQQIRTPAGELLRALPTEDLDDSGLPMLVTLLRSDLQRILLERLGQSAVRLAHECISVEQHGDRVLARFAHGDEAEGSVLVGADGLGSAVRAGLHGAQAPVHLGIGVWRGIARSDHELFARRIGFQSLGHGRRFAALPLAGNAVYWAATQLFRQGTWQPEVPALARVCDVFSRWHAPIPQLIVATPAESLVWTEVHDRPPLSRWGRGRVTLLGDAAHPVAPFLGQGACQALEDAVWLTRHLASSDAPEQALRAFEDQRSRRTRKIAEASRKMGRMYHLKNPLSVTLRNLAMKHAPRSIMAKPLRETLATDL